VAAGYEHLKGTRIGKLGFMDALAVMHSRGSAIARRLSRTVTRAWADLWHSSFSGKCLLVGSVIVLSLVLDVFTYPQLRVLLYRKADCGCFAMR
jgi:hypothetical protein